MTKPCTKCGGSGTYLSTRCVDEVCHHRARYVTKIEDLRPVKGDAWKGKALKREKKLIPRCMPCPQRPCSCPAGAIARADLRRRVWVQEADLRARA